MPNRFNILCRNNISPSARCNFNIYVCLLFFFALVLTKFRRERYTLSLAKHVVRYTNASRWEEATEKTIRHLSSNRADSDRSRDSLSLPPLLRFVIFFLFHRANTKIGIVFPICRFRAQALSAWTCVRIYAERRRESRRGVYGSLRKFDGSVWTHQRVGKCASLLSRGIVLRARGGEEREGNAFVAVGVRKFCRSRAARNGARALPPLPLPPPLLAGISSHPECGRAERTAKSAAYRAVRILISTFFG